MTSVKVSSFIIAQQRVLGDARVGDEHLDRALLGLDLVEGGVDVGRAGHVAAHAEQPLGRLSGAVGDGDGVAGRGEFAGDREADAAIAAGDEDRASHGRPDAIVLPGG